MARKPKSSDAIKPVPKHGGRRAGAGRKPKPVNVVRPVVSALVNDATGLDAEGLDALFKRAAPQCVANLVVLANGGDLKANIYIVDRVLGKPRQAIEVKQDDLTVKLALAEQVAAEHVPDTKPEG